MKNAMLAVALVCASVASVAQDKATKPSPPYLISRAHHYIVGVVWNEEAVKLLPAGVRSTPERTGGINLVSDGTYNYDSRPYRVGYIWIDVEGHDSADGSKARYIPKAGHTAAAPIKALWKGNGDIVSGDVRLEDGGVKRGTSTRNGKEWIEVTIKGSDECQEVAGTLNYLVTAQEMIQIPWAGTGCKAEPVSAKISLTAGENGAGLQPIKLLFAVEAKDSRYALTLPVPVK